MQNDVALLDAAKGMNEDALATIFDQYAPALYNYVLRAGGDPLMADHIVGDVFARLLDQLSCGNGPHANLRSYLFEITYHLLVDQVRYGQRRVPLEVAEYLRQDRHPADVQLEDRILFEQVSRAILDELTDYQRQVIVLRFMEGFSLRETAAILGKSVNIIKAAQNRAVVTLRKCLWQWGRM